MENELILVDIFDEEVGSCSKLDAHRKGYLHRAFSVFVVHDGKMLLQKRNAKKYHSGGLWTNACCSHPRKGERLSEAVSRRLLDELGVSFPTHECFSFVYRTEFANGIIEYELDHVLLSDYSGDIHPNPEEIEEICWIDFGELKDKLSTTPECFTSWFIIAVPKVLKLLNCEAANCQRG